MLYLSYAMVFTFYFYQSAHCSIPVHCLLEYLHHLFLIYQVKATAENVDEAVRELPDANLVRYSFWVSIWVLN